MDSFVVDFNGERKAFDFLYEIQDDVLGSQLSTIDNSGPITSDLSLYNALESRLFCTNVDICRIDVRHGTHVYEVRPYYRSEYEDGKQTVEATNPHSPCYFDMDYDDGINTRVKHTRFDLSVGEFIVDITTVQDASEQFVQGMLLRTSLGRQVYFGSGRSRLRTQSSSDINSRNDSAEDTRHSVSNHEHPRLRHRTLQHRCQQEQMTRRRRRRHCRVLAFIHQYHWASLMGEAPAFLHRLGIVAVDVSNWTYIKDFICLRELVRQGRASPYHRSSCLNIDDDDLNALRSIFGKKSVSDRQVLQDLWLPLCQCPDDVFRHIMSFIAPIPFDRGAI